jgi:hypothetical protein
MLALRTVIDFASNLGALKRYYEPSRRLGLGGFEEANNFSDMIEELTVFG